MLGHTVMLLLVLGCVLSDDCVTPNGEKAKCIPVRSCPIILKAITTYEPSNIEFAKQSQCGYTTQPLVCCGSFGNYQTTTTSTISPTDKKNALIPDKRYCGNQRYNDHFHTGNDDCLTPNGEKGTCVPICCCPIIINSMFTFEQSNVEFAKKSRCGFTTEPLVCCGSFGNYQTTTTTTIRPTVKKNALIPDKRYCGYQRYDDYFHTGNSTSSSIDEFPWLASLRYNEFNGTDAGFKCAGSLITNKHVLTAAHCIVTRDFILASVRLGEYNAKSEKDCIKNEQFDECTEPVIDVGINKTIIHSLYRGYKYMYDIGLIKLNVTIVYSDYIRPICLPFPGTKLAKIRDILIQSGWGNTHFRGEVAIVKKKGRTELLSNDECRKEFDSHRKGNITEAFTCTRETRDSASVSCQGDSGGPVMFFNRNQWHQEGIISFGKGCGFDKPSVNTNVMYYIDWIVDNLKP